MFLKTVQQGGGNNNIYSTSETVCGTWNGSTLYRKVFSGTVTASGGTVGASIGDIDITKIKRTECILHGSDHSVFTPYYDQRSSANSDYLRAWIENSDKKIHIGIGDSYPTRPATYDFIIEYTK